MGICVAVAWAPVQLVGAAPAGGPSITVDNTATNPVPVTGTVNAVQNGLWTVGINNFPATQAVSGTVGIDSTQNSVKLDSNLVREANSLAISPHKMSNRGTFGTGNPEGFNAFVPLGAVPAGYRFVATYASVEAHVPAGQNVIFYLARSDSDSPRWKIPAFDQGTFNVSGANQFFVGGQEVAITFEPGETVLVGAFRSQADAVPGQVSGAVQGYLVRV